MLTARRGSSLACPVAVVQEGTGGPSGPDGPPRAIGAQAAPARPIATAIATTAGSRIHPEYRDWADSSVTGYGGEVAHRPLVSDQSYLRNVQYRGEANLAARQSVYAWQHRRIDLPG